MHLILSKSRFISLQPYNFIFFFFSFTLVGLVHESASSSSSHNSQLFLYIRMCVRVNRHVKLTSSPNLDNLYGTLTKKLDFIHQISLFSLIFSLGLFSFCYWRCKIDDFFHLSIASHITMIIMWCDGGRGYVTHLLSIQMPSPSSVTTTKTDTRKTIFMCTWW